MPLTPDQLIRAEIRALSAYHVPDSGGMIKLDAMENPYALPSTLRAEIALGVAQVAINRYPDPAATDLKCRLREVMRIPASMEIMLGNGSDELIQIVSMAVATPGAVLLAVEPSFVMYRMIAAYTGMRYVGVPLESDFSLNLEGTLAAIQAHQPALIFIAYPNNPTGNLFDAHAVSRIIQAAPGLVVVDEAYQAFADTSFMSRLDDYPNLLVMRTLSKSGLAGLRLGFLVGRAAWLNELDKLRLPYNINSLTQVVAQQILQHPDVLDQQAQQIKAQRVVLQQQLSALAGVEAYPSDANFILLRVAEADRVFAELKQRGVLIKNLNHSHAMLNNCLRVTVGTAQENATFMQALHESI